MAETQLEFPVPRAATEQPHPGVVVDTLLARLEETPDDVTTLDQLRQTALAWLELDHAAGDPSVAPDRGRIRLAAWLAHLARGGKIVHFGRSGGAIAEALASAGGSVTSFLDHPGRAILAALDYPQPFVLFGTLQGLDQAPRELADLAVVETAGVDPVISLTKAFNCVRAGGWLAVLGMPVLLELHGIVEVGTFCFDPAHGVRPSVNEALDTRITLLRLVAPQSAPARGLERLLCGG